MGSPRVDEDIDAVEAIEEPSKRHHDLRCVSEVQRQCHHPSPDCGDLCGNPAQLDPASTGQAHSGTGLISLNISHR